MWYRNATRLLLMLALVIGPSTARALNILSLEPSEFAIDAGDPLELDLRMNFDDTTLGGGVLLSFDESVLRLVSITFDGDLGDDPGFRCPGAMVCPADPNFISFGDFGGLSGDLLVAKIVFDTLAVSSTLIDLLADRPFSDASGSALAVDLRGAVIPEPSTFLLVVLGMTGLSVRRRYALS